MAKSAKKKLTVLIVDDEEPARSVVREMLGAHPDIEIIGEAANGLEAVGLATKKRPDIVFLDVQMPKLDGLETVELLDTEIAVVFATAYDDYALRAFDVNAVDYLLKPFSAERFSAALDRARARVGRHRGFDAAQLAAAARPQGTYCERIVVKDGARVEIIAARDLDFAKGQADYVELFSRGRSVLKQQTLQSLEACLDPTLFVRIHRSYLLNLSRLQRIEPWGADSKLAVLSTGEQLPISRAGLTRLNEILGPRSGA